MPALEHVHRWISDERGDESVGGAVVDLVRRRELLQLALAHDRHEVGHRHRLGLVVRDVQRRRPEPLLQALDLAAHRRAQLGVEVRERLVHEEDRRLAHDRPRQRDALSLAAREVPRPAVEQVRDLERLRDPLHAGALLAPCSGRGCAAGSRCSRPPSCADRARSSGTPSRRRGRAAGCASRRGRRCARCRRSGSSRPASTRSAVVLPQPDGPSSTRNAPSGTSRSSERSASDCCVEALLDAAEADLAHACLGGPVDSRTISSPRTSSRCSTWRAVVDGREHQLGGARSHGRRVLTHRRQPDAVVRRQRHVVEAGHGDVLGHAQAAPLERVHEVDRHAVVHAADGRRRRRRARPRAGRAGARRPRRPAACGRPRPRARAGVRTRSARVRDRRGSRSRRPSPLPRRCRSRPRGGRACRRTRRASSARRGRAGRSRLVESSARAAKMTPSTRRETSARHCAASISGSPSVSAISTA